MNNLVGRELSVKKLETESGNRNKKTRLTRSSSENLAEDLQPRHYWFRVGEMVK